MKQITLKLTEEEARAVYIAMARLRARDNETMIAAEKFPKSEILREGAEEAEERKEHTNAVLERIVKGMGDEWWRKVKYGK